MNKTIKEKAYATNTTIFFLICAGIMFLTIFFINDTTKNAGTVLLRFINVFALCLFAAGVYFNKRIVMLFCSFTIIVCELIQSIIVSQGNCSIEDFFLYYLPRVKMYALLLIIVLLMIFIKDSVENVKNIRIIFYLPAIDGSLYIVMLVLLFSKKQEFVFTDIITSLYLIMETLGLVFFAKWVTYKTLPDESDRYDDACVNEIIVGNAFDNLEDRYQDNDDTYKEDDIEIDSLLDAYDDGVEPKNENYFKIQDIVEETINNQDEKKENDKNSSKKKILNLKKPDALLNKEETLKKPDKVKNSTDGEKSNSSKTMENDNSNDENSNDKKQILKDESINNVKDKPQEKYVNKKKLDLKKPVDLLKKSAKEKPKMVNDKPLNLKKDKKN